MDDNTKQRLRLAFKLGYAHGQYDKSVEQLYYDSEIVRLARTVAWNNHDSTRVRLTRDEKNFILPDGWPPGANEDAEVEAFVEKHFPGAKDVHGGEPDDHEL